MAKYYDRIYKSCMQRKMTNNYPFPMQKKEKTEDCHSKGKDKTRLTIVPLIGNHIQARESKLERIS